jgi:carbamoylphosphate synthase large subunit
MENERQVLYNTNIEEMVVVLSSGSTVSPDHSTRDATEVIQSCGESTEELQSVNNGDRIQSNLGVLKELEAGLKNRERMIMNDDGVNLGLRKRVTRCQNKHSFFFVLFGFNLFNRCC